jgi:hypothetical protein
VLIAQRLLYWAHSGKHEQIGVRIFLPAKVESAWTCRYEIDWPDKMRSRSAAGNDSVQALLGAMQMIGSDIVASTYYASGEIVLDASYLGCGFPVPHNIRHLLRGDDAKFAL